MGGNKEPFFVDSYFTSDRQIVSDSHAEAIQGFTEKVQQGVYETRALACLCGTPGKDDLIANYDRYGIPLTTKLCKTCGLLRSDPYYTDEAIVTFYKEDYVPIYRVQGTPEQHFNEQRNLKAPIGGQFIYEFCSPFLPQDAMIYEIGCSAGGNLSLFKDNGYLVKGCDYAEEYIDYGIERGLDLHIGDWKVLEKYGKADLIILNHVFEHIVDPYEFLQDITTYLLSDNGMVFIGVPGIFDISVCYDDRLNRYLQNAHVYHYSLETLKYITSRSNLQFLDGNDIIMSLFKKNISVDPIPFSVKNYFYAHRVLRHSKKIGEERFQLVQAGKAKKQSDITINLLEQKQLKSDQTVSQLKSDQIANQLKFDQITNQLKSDRWYRFGQLSRSKKILTAGKIVSKKLRIYWIIQPVVKLVKKLKNNG